MSVSRRSFLQAGAGIAAILAAGRAPAAVIGKPRVVVIGGGFGGATAARYLSLWGAGKVDVTLVERNPEFISCPVSNLVLTGERSLDQLRFGYEGLTARGIRVLRGEVAAVDAAARTVKLSDGSTLPWDRLVIAPGVDFRAVPGVDSEQIPHAWKAGPQTLLLQRQLAAMADGGVFAICVPKAPYRCPPGPYERACLVADWFQRTKPKAKVLVLDANPEIVSKKALFARIFAERFPKHLEYIPNSELMEVKGRSALLEFDTVQADVLNVIPPQQASAIARLAGLVNVNDRWCDVDWRSMEATATPGIHVLGDACFPTHTMPKSAHMANQHGKLAAAAILATFDGRAPDPAPILMNTCYSYINAREAIHVSSVHAWDEAKRTLMPVAGAGGLSAAPSEEEGGYAAGWARNIWFDTLG
ncbi:MAG TPA: NAD(P)/FAD-dependent oxidoreductase [Rhodocyclaceae bacterium]